MGVYLPGYNSECTSFKVFYGWDPPKLVKYETKTTTATYLEEQLLDRDASIDESKFSLLRAQQRINVMDKKGRRSFSILGTKCTSDFNPIVRRHVVYKLDLPEGSAIHLVFHVSQLQPTLGQRSSCSELPPLLDNDEDTTVEPELLMRVTGYLSSFFFFPTASLPKLQFTTSIPQNQTSIPQTKGSSKLIGE
ncbi:hypothetical protein LXL04_032913 [Taraxacum kok-saghyz]